jgi:hypothetical protein
MKTIYAVKFARHTRKSQTPTLLATVAARRLVVVAQVTTPLSILLFPPALGTAKKNAMLFQQVPTWVLVVEIPK